MTTTNSNDRAWSKPQITDLKRQLEQQWKGLLPHISTDVFDALVRAKCHEVATMRDESTFTAEQLFNLYLDLRERFPRLTQHD